MHNCTGEDANCSLPEPRNSLLGHPPLSRGTEHERGLSADALDFFRKALKTACAKDHAARQSLVVKLT
jgi:hypothetical protein